MARLSSHWTPAVLVAVPALSWLGMTALGRADAAPEVAQTLMMVFVISTMAALAGVAMWFLFLARYRWRTKLVGSTVAVALVAGGVGAIRKLEFDAAMVPHAQFRWEKSAAQEFRDYAATAPKDPARADLTIRPGDSPAFRSTPSGLRPIKTLALAWKNPAGAGHGGMAVAGDSIITIEQRDAAEAVVCLNRDTGAVRWATTYPAEYATSEPMGGGGPRTTPAITPDGKVLTVGATGILTCLEGATGSILWQADTVKESGAALPIWAISGSPLVIGTQVVVHPGVDPANNTDQAVAAYDIATGKRLWAKGKHPAAYATPQLVTLAGVRQLVIFDADGVAGLNPASGEELWRTPWKGQLQTNAMQPLALPPVGEKARLFVSGEKTEGCAAFELVPGGSVWDIKRAWQNRAIASRFSSPVEVAGRIYGLSTGRLVCLDAATGKSKYDEIGFGAGQVLVGAGQLVITGESGELTVADANADDYSEVAKLKVFDARTWNMPALTDRQVFVRNHRGIACVTLGFE